MQTRRELDQRGCILALCRIITQSARGRGLAGQMLVAAEAEGRARGCRSAYIDTFNPIALRTYQRAGYAPFGALEDFPEGRTRTFLQKKL